MWQLFWGATIVRLVFGIISIPGIYLVEEHSQDWAKMSGITHSDPPSFSHAQGQLIRRASARRDIAAASPRRTRRFSLRLGRL